MPEGHCQHGFFGKLPAAGDFLNSGMPDGFISVWDEWLQKGLISSKSALGDAWRAAYLAAPIWRFTLSPGLAGASGIAGILMCSVDRVGRLFPFTIARALEKSEAAVHRHATMTAEFEALEEIALDAMEDELSAADLGARLSQTVLAPPLAAPLPGVAPQGSLLSFDLSAPGDIAPVLATALVERQYVAPSVWSALTQSNTRLCLYEGLPSPDRMSDFLTIGKDRASTSSPH